MENKVSLLFSSPQLSSLHEITQERRGDRKEGAAMTAAAAAAAHPAVLSPATSPVVICSGIHGTKAFSDSLREERAEYCQ